MQLEISMSRSQFVVNFLEILEMTVRKDVNYTQRSAREEDVQVLQSDC